MSNFLSFVEIRTKIASQLPFLFGTAYAAAHWGKLNWISTLLFFLSVLLFDMTTTAVNNAIDTHLHHGPTRAHYSPAVSLLLILMMLGAASGCGIVLALRTGPVVLLTGLVCFGAGLLYTAGPLPLSRLPVGEVFSGFFMGLVLPFLAVYINAPADALVTLSYTGGVLGIGLAVPALLRLGIACVPAMMGIAGIMLANNICDLPDDRAVGRFTLPHFLGLRTARVLFAGLYVVSFVSIPAMAVSGALPIWVLIVLAAAVPVGRNVRAFLRNPSKEATFLLSVANLVWMMVPLIAVAALAAATGGLR